MQSSKYSKDNISEKTFKMNSYTFRGSNFCIFVFVSHLIGISGALVVQWVEKILTSRGSKTWNRYISRTALWNRYISKTALFKGCPADIAVPGPADIAVPGFKGCPADIAVPGPADIAVPGFGPFKGCPADIAVPGPADIAVPGFGPT